MDLETIRGSDRYTALVSSTTHKVLESAGAAPAQQRWAAFHRRLDELPHDLRAYVDKVARHAYRVNDDDIDALKRAGYTEDAIFEITAAAALGAAITRLERGLIVLNESRA